MHDVIIIGAGAAGLSAARWCDELGLDTLVLEQAEEVGGHNSCVISFAEYSS
ncbi:MAG TPA: FAD-dependent oxidoreductase [Pyrinomonadaceae bacterium]|nr:FAD-dependent oxidoreductase [Pyrinomonadaceae bacterium]